MLKNIISLSKELISIPSTPDNKKALEKTLTLVLSRLKTRTIEPFERNGVKSALIHNKKKGHKKFNIILNGHLDIIPGKDDQYKPFIQGRRLYGVGAMDMKANVACLIAAFQEAADKVRYPLGLQLVTDEEIGGFDGTKYQIEKGVRANFAIIGESTNLDIENRAKGVLWLKIRAKGRSAHGAYPWKGENAVAKMNDFLNALRKAYPSPKKAKWITTINLASVETKNKTFNKIPDDCEALIDIRHIPEEGEAILPKIKNMLPKGFSLEVAAKEPALATPAQNPHVQSLKKEVEKHTGKQSLILSANGSSDARHFARVGCPAIEFGPKGGGMGSDREWVDIPGLEKYYEILKNFLLRQ